MNVGFIRDRITQLRTQKGVSEYQMSLDLGHSRSYMQGISSGRALPSVQELLYICEYLDITPQQFFDADCRQPAKLNELTRRLKRLDQRQLDALIQLLDSFETGEEKERGGR